MLSPFDLEIMRQFADQIEAHRERRFLAEGINAYVEYLWDSEGCPVFADIKKYGDAAVAFLKLLRKLDIYDKDPRYGSYDRNAVQPWLGIKPTFGSETPVQSPGLFGFRFAIVMSYIVLKADSATNCQSGDAICPLLHGWTNGSNFRTSIALLCLLARWTSCRSGVCLGSESAFSGAFRAGRAAPAPATKSGYIPQESRGI